uniref:VWFA domain-containing protein n=1 Tax=Scleropages formosus TaxID=113540 RepID=A0A8C9SC05_SCLFO
GELKPLLEQLPSEEGAESSEIRVGFVTYNKATALLQCEELPDAAPDDGGLHDAGDTFVPLLDGFLNDFFQLSLSPPFNLLNQISDTFADTDDRETAFAPAIQEGVGALKAADRRGKLSIFHSPIPAAEAPGKRRNRDDEKLVNTKKEKTLFQPARAIYEQLSGDRMSIGRSVDLFPFPNQHVDVDALGDVSLFQVHAAHLCDVPLQTCCCELDRDPRTDVQQPIRFDADQYFGTVRMSNTTDLEMAAVGCNKAVTVEFEHDDTLSEDSGALIRASIQMLRVHDPGFSCCSLLVDGYKSCETDALLDFCAKSACRTVFSQPLKAMRETLLSHTARILACYRRNCASPSSMSQVSTP